MIALRPSTRQEMLEFLQKLAYMQSIAQRVVQVYGYRHCTPVAVFGHFPKCDFRAAIRERKAAGV